MPKFNPHTSLGPINVIYIATTQPTNQNKIFVGVVLILVRETTTHNTTPHNTTPHNTTQHHTGDDYNSGRKLIFDKPPYDNPTR
jgi:hypothetical protein